MGFVGRLRADILLAGRLKPFMVEENRLYSTRMFDLEWEGWVTVFGFLRRGRRFYCVSDLDAPAEELKERFDWKWRLENFIDEFSGCSQAKARAHAFTSSLLGRLTGAFRATAKTIRLLLRAVKRASIDRGRLVVEVCCVGRRQGDNFARKITFKFNGGLQLD